MLATGAVIVVIVLSFVDERIAAEGCRATARKIGARENRGR
jgi:hypothetical protein